MEITAAESSVTETEVDPVMFYSSFQGGTSPFILSDMQCHNYDAATNSIEILSCCCYNVLGVRPFENFCLLSVVRYQITLVRGKHPVDSLPVLTCNSHSFASHKVTKLKGKP